MAANVWVFFITPDANRIHGESEITGFPILDRGITLENSPWKHCRCFRRPQPHAVEANAQIGGGTTEAGCAERRVLVATHLPSALRCRQVNSEYRSFAKRCFCHDHQTGRVLEFGRTAAVCGGLRDCSHGASIG
jgi:hypothetical protein